MSQYRRKLDSKFYRTTC